MRRFGSRSSARIDPRTLTRKGRETRPGRLISVVGGVPDSGFSGIVAAVCHSRKHERRLRKSNLGTKKSYFSLSLFSRQSRQVRMRPRVLADSLRADWGSFTGICDLLFAPAKIASHW